tara:strand:- start:639 stop:860 length:222 start_codon:yes stop_codon:yes gene_type:complete
MGKSSYGKHKTWNYIHSWCIKQIKGVIMGKMKSLVTELGYEGAEKFLKKAHIRFIKKKKEKADAVSNEKKREQ